MSLLPLVLGLTAAPRLEAARVTTPPVLDGRLDDAAWSVGKSTHAFTQRSPHDGAPATERTIVRVVYDDTAVYVGIDCPQTHAPVVALLSRRDRSTESDSVTVGLDPQGEGRTGLSFSVNAAGVLVDGKWTDDTTFSSDFDEIWEAKTAVRRDGWSAEIRLPLRALRFSGARVQSWGLQLRRYVSALQETDEWAYAPRSQAGEVSRWGHLDGLTALAPSAGLELRPFAVAALRRDDPETTAGGAQPLVEGGAGLDLLWHVTPSLTLDATVNPDFGQVETDQVILNLSSYEQFFPEKRPFFLEGREAFTTPEQLVYTRRIGHVPGEPALREGESLVRPPAPVTIAGAAKLTGPLGGGLAAGEMLALTLPSFVRVRRPDGTFDDRVAEPLTTYKALRLRQNVGAKSQVGIAATAVDRYEEPSRYPVVPGDRGPERLCPGGEAQRRGGRCFHDAYVGAVDGRFRSSGGDWVATAQALGTLIHEGPPRRLDDGTVVSSGDGAVGAALAVEKEGGEHWIGRLGYEGLGRKVDFNDLGFMQRQAVHRFEAFVGYRTLEPAWHLLETDGRVVAFDRENLDGLNLLREVAINTYAKYDNFWESFAEVDLQAAHFDDREVGDGTALERAGLVGFALYVGTDPRKVLRVGAFGQVQLLPDDGLNVYAEGTLALRPVPALEIEILPQGFRDSGEPRYVGAENDRYVFGRLVGQSFGTTVRATYTFVPELTLQAYAQLFLASERYGDFSFAPNPASGPRPVVRLADLIAAGAPSDNPDYSEGVLNASVVLRWEFRLGSTLYLVYTHSQDKTRAGTQGPARLDFGLAEPRGAGEGILVKLAYWMG